MSQQNSIILGIDPGLEKTGFGVIAVEKGIILAKDFGIFFTLKTESIFARLHQISRDIEEILHLWKPQILAIEKLVFVQNVTNGLLVAQARGIILEKAYARGVQILEFAPTEIKNSVTGNGRAPKIQVQNMVQMALNLPELPQPDDAADALAVALTASSTNL